MAAGCGRAEQALYNLLPVSNVHLRSTPLRVTMSCFFTRLVLIIALYSLMIYAQNPTAKRPTVTTTTLKPKILFRNCKY